MDGKHKVCILQYHKGNQPYASYTLYANGSGQITTLIRSTWIVWAESEEGKIYYETTTFREDTVQVDSDTVQKINRILPRFPEPQPSYSDWHMFGSPLNVDNYSLSLYTKDDEKHYSYGHGGSSFSMSHSDFDLWLSLVKRLLVMFEDLTGNINQLRPIIEDKVDAYHDAFHKKGKYNKYQRRWTEPQLSTWVYHHVSYAHFFDEFVDENISNDELRQIDFRHYLSSFLWLIAFQKTVVSYPPKLIDVMTVCQRICETDVLKWDADEQDALRDYFTALWDYVLAYYPPLGMDAYTFVHGVGLTGLDVTDYIKHWKSSIDDVQASRHLAGYVRSLYAQYVESGADVFDDVPKILRRWLRDAGEGDYFLKRYMAYDGVRPFADEYAEASEMLSLLHDEGL